MWHELFRRLALARSSKGVSPEVFGAWFTGFGKADMNINPQRDVRIVQPSGGLKDWYTQRSDILKRHIEAVRKAKGGEPAKAAEKKDAPTAKAEPSKDEPKKEGESKKAEAPK